MLDVLQSSYLLCKVRLNRFRLNVMLTILFTFLIHTRSEDVASSSQDNLLVLDPVSDVIQNESIPTPVCSHLQTMSCAPVPAPPCFGEPTATGTNPAQEVCNSYV